MNRLRWGILGCGKISNDFALVLRQLSEIAVVHACAARSLSKAEAFASKHGCKKSYGSYAELCEDADIDIVYVGTIHPSHLELIQCAVKNGKHVLVEKPMTINQYQASRVFSLVRESQCFFLEGMWTRFFPAVRYLRELLGRMEIGEIRHVNANIGFHFSHDAERIWNRTLGGGGLLDIGVYALQYVLLAFGKRKIEKIEASGKLTDGNVDAYGSITLHYDDDSFGTVQYTCVAQMQERVSIIGTRGSIEIEPIAHIPSKITLTRHAPAPNSGIQRVTKEFPLPTDDPSKYEFEGSTGFRYEIEAITQCIQSKQRQAAEFTWDESMQLQEIMDQVRSQLHVVYPGEES